MCRFLSSLNGVRVLGSLVLGINVMELGGLSLGRGIHVVFHCGSSYDLAGVLLLATLGHSPFSHLSPRDGGCGGGMRSEVNRAGLCHRPWLSYGSLGLKNPSGYRLFRVRPYSHRFWGGGCRSTLMVLCRVSKLYCMTWWKRHRLHAFLFPRNPRRIMRERLVYALHSIPFQPAVRR